MTRVERLKTFIEDELLESPEVITPETPLFSSSLLDSLALLNLLSFLEDEFSVKIRAADVQIENFDTILSIEQLIAGKLSERH